MNPDGVQTVCSKRVMCTKTDDPSGKLCAMRQAVDGAPAFVYNEYNNAHRAWPGTGANSPQRVQCPLRGADTEDTNVTKKKIGVLGAGTWGMALARMLCVSGNDVQVWSALPAEVENLSATRCCCLQCRRYLCAPPRQRPGLTSRTARSLWTLQRAWSRTLYIP